MATPPSTRREARAQMRKQRLYINVDHVATVRQARRGRSPDPVEAAVLCEQAGADGITAHLREDRRHIQDDDIRRLATSIRTVLNLEMACTDEMLGIATRLRPHQVTLVPERREEITTEGGLDVGRDTPRLRDGITRLNAAGIRTSLFIAPDPAAIEQSKAIGAAAVELHTGQYAHAPHDPVTIGALRESARVASVLGLAVHAGHGLDVANVGLVAAIAEIEELNIGHAIVSRAIFVGIAEAVREMRRAMDAARRDS
ncbi:MAG TPA: pyridoxine 5'-phosphate synthase [Gemmatimonadaceae bacterium]|nr:pyridoxine 5'-phosphate synthase [Gemmatimonadaceae bacterium]